MFKYPLILIAILNCVNSHTKEMYDVHLKDLEIKDIDPETLKTNLIQKCFKNKYKVYSFQELREFYYELYLGMDKNPSIKQLKKLKPFQKDLLEMIDNFLAEIKTERYTHSTIIQMIKEKDFEKFKKKRFKDIVNYVKLEHERKYKEHIDELKSKKANAKEVYDFIGGEL